MQHILSKQGILFVYFFISIIILLPISFAHADGTVSIQGLNPGTVVTPGTTVSFFAAITGFTRPSFTVVDSASSTLRADDIFNSGTFYWTPAMSDVGPHTLTVSVSDFYGNAASASQVITVSATSSLSVPSTIPGSSITTGQPFTFSVTPQGILNPNYTIKDSFGNSSISSTNINVSGTVVWTPANSDVGQHTLQIIGTDYHGVIASVSIPITVVGISATVQNESASSTVVGIPFTFQIDTTGFTTPTYLAYDSTFGSSFNGSNIDVSGKVTWTPTSIDSGTHTLNIIVSDLLGHSTTVRKVIIVGQPSLTIGSLSPGAVVAVGTPVTFNLLQNSLASPTYVISDSMYNTSIASTSINSLGIFNWTPVVTDIGTHVLNITFSDVPGHYVATSLGLRVVASGTPISITAPAAPQTGTPHSSTKYVFTKVLSLGSSGAAVTALQNLLTVDGVYSGPIIGTFGPRTQVAVKLFQKKHGLSQVGSVGPATRALLNQL
ncbi:MAG: sleB1 [Candidatus Kaiserbacteria bacterium]|nr:sleB1 [Candidatus Kaiserbacteria bacterium]